MPPASANAPRRPRPWELTIEVVAVAVLAAACWSPRSTQEGEPTASEPEPPGEVLDVEMALAVMTRPDSGPLGEAAHRWDQADIKVFVDLPGFPSDLLGEVSAAMSWVSESSGVRFHTAATAAEADMRITEIQSNGGQVRVTVDGFRIEAAEVQLGCCRVRPVWEEISQAMGPLGDRADGRSLFSQDVASAQRGTTFDEWVLRSLYAAPLGANIRELRSSLESHRVP